MPTVVTLELNAEKYERDLSEAVAQSHAAAAKIAAAVGSEELHATVKVDSSEVDEAAAKVDDLKKNDGESVNISVNVEQVGDLKGVSGDLADVKKTAEKVPSKTFIGAIGDDLKGAWKNLTDVQGSFKKLFSTIGAGGGGIAILAAGLMSLVKIGTWIKEQFDKAKYAVAELFAANAQSIREAAEVNEKMRQTTDGYMSKLGDLANAEKLSNSQKAEAIRLIAALSKSYGDLGVRIDEATGRITGLDEAMIKKIRRDRDRRDAELKAENKELAAEQKVQAEIRDNAGVEVDAFIHPLMKLQLAASKKILNKFGISTEGMEGWRIGGGEKVEKAQSVIKESQDKQNANLRKMHENRSGAREQEDAYRAQRKGLLTDLKRAASEAEQQRISADLDDRYSELMNSGDFVNAAELKRGQLESMRTKEAELSAKVDAAQKAVDTSTNDDAKREAEINRLQLQKELEAHKEKEVAVNRQILDAEKKILEVRESSAKASDEIRDSYNRKIDDLAGRAAEAAGQGREYAERRALEEAEKRKGGKLNADESNAVKRLSALEYDMSHFRRPGADLTIRSNALTARGGFRTGAAAPDAQKYAKMTVDCAKQQLSELNQIREQITKWGGVDGEY